MMSSPRLLVFDLDGTLIDSSRDLCHSVNAALNHVGKPSISYALIASYIGDGAPMLVRRALDDLNAKTPGISESPNTFDAAYHFFLNYYRGHKLDNTCCYPGVLQALASIRNAAPDLPMAVLTNKPVRPSRDICSALGLAPYFFQNYGGNSFDTKKPDPEGLLHLIAEANSLQPASQSITPADTVMIGDSDVDVRTARACGARSIGCTYGLSAENLLLAAPDLLSESPSRWPALLGLA